MFPQKDTPNLGSIKEVEYNLFVDKQLNREHVSKLDDGKTRKVKGIKMRPTSGFRRLAIVQKFIDSVARTVKDEPQLPDISCDSREVPQRP